MMLAYIISGRVGVTNKTLTGEWVRRASKFYLMKTSNLSRIEALVIKGFFSHLEAIKKTATVNAKVDSEKAKFFKLSSNFSNGSTRCQMPQNFFFFVNAVPTR